MFCQLSEVVCLEKVGFQKDPVRIHFISSCSCTVSLSPAAAQHHVSEGSSQDTLHQSLQLHSIIFTLVVITSFVCFATFFVKPINPLEKIDEMFHSNSDVLKAIISIKMHHSCRNMRPYIICTISIYFSISFRMLQEK